MRKRGKKIVKKKERLMIEKNKIKEENKEIKLIVASNIKSAVPELQVSGDVPEALNKKAIEILEKGSERAKANGRRTLYARDL